MSATGPTCPDCGAVGGFHLGSCDRVWDLRRSRRETETKVATLEQRAQAAEAKVAAWEPVMIACGQALVMSQGIRQAMATVPVELRPKMPMAKR